MDNLGWRSDPNCRKFDTPSSGRYNGRMFKKMQLRTALPVDHCLKTISFVNHFSGL